MSQDLTNELTSALAAATRAHPIDRKILVCGNRLVGAEMLRALTLSGTPWIGWEVATPWRIALELVPASSTLADEFRVMRLVDESIDAVVAAGNTDLSDALASVSFRDAVHRAVSLLRSSGATTAPDANVDRILRATLLVKADYERRLHEAGLLDHADVLQQAIARLKSGANFDAKLFIAPSTNFGLRGELIRLLLGAGAAELLPTEAIHGLEGPAQLLRASAPHASHAPQAFLHAPESRPDDEPRLYLFAAATPMDELREVLRRITAQNLAWDQVEIIATDPRTYGSALYAQARRLGIPLTLTNGIDLARTRTGRAARGYLAWLRESYPAETMRGLLETGDVATRESNTSGTRLGYRLRRLRIGWGKRRYYEVIERAIRASMSSAAPDDERDAIEAERERERERSELRALRDILFPILDAAPDAPVRLHTTETRVAPAAIARGLLVFLDHVASGDESDALVRGYVRDRLERAAAELTRETGWYTALAIIERVVDARVSPDDDGEPAWTSAPGRLHFSDLRTGGWSGRPHVFVVGLDANRVAANAGVDPILTDRARREVLGLPTARERAAQRRYELAELLARLRGAVTLSYSAWDATEGRAVPPAMELLQALRLMRRDAALTYTDLDDHLGGLAGAVPLHGRLDAHDVWLGTLASATGVLHAATGLVRAAYPHLERGHRAREAREGLGFNEYQGMLRRMANANRTFSATQLEALGTCPRRYLYRYLMKVEAPEIHEFNPEQWLDARERGSLLHKTFEQTLERARAQGIEYDEREFWNLAKAVLFEIIEDTKGRVPPPGDEVLQREIRDLGQDLKQWVRLIRQRKPQWLALEQRFGEREPFVLDTPVGPLRLRGAIDRVDELEDGRLLVVDYKTGKKYGYWPSRPYNGGRRIQHVVYSAAAERLFGREVAAMEYHFPTTRGDNEVVQYYPRMLGPAGEALGRLLRVAGGNAFPTTDDPRDCKYCDFAVVCRATVDHFGTVSAARVDWMKNRGLELDEAAGLRILRRVDG